MSLVDENGRLLPTELCNIKTLECLTKDRAPSPARRSPSRNGTKQHENTRSSSPKLPAFVQGLNDSKGNRTTSPTALRVGASFGEQGKNSVNVSLNGQGGQKEDRLSASSAGVSGNTLICNSDADTFKKSRKMKSNEEENIDEKSTSDQLPKKPVSLWTKEDVCDWLDHIQLKHFKESFVRQGVTGKTLLNLNYETLDELDLSKSSEEREYFLAEVYKLQQENEMDKEIQDTLHGASGVMRSSISNSESDVSEHVQQTSTEQGTGVEKDDIFQELNQVSNNSQHVIGQDKATSSSQESRPKTRKESSKHGEKKTKSRGKRISRFWNSFNPSNKNSTVVDGMLPSTIYKNAFHNLMNTGPQGVIKVWTEMFITDMQYVSLLVSYEATSCDVVEMVLEKSNVQEDPECYCICEVNHEKNEYVLGKNESPLQRERQWLDPDNCRFELRWQNERLIEWRNTPQSLTQDLSLEKTDEEGSSVKDENVDSSDSGGSTEERPTISPSQSPKSDSSQKLFLETSFDYNVEVEEKKSEKMLPLAGAQREVTSSRQEIASQEEVTSRQEITSREEVTSPQEMASRQDLTSQEEGTSREEMASGKEMTNNQPAMTSRQEIASHEEVTCQEETTSREEITAEERLNINDAAKPSEIVGNGAPEKVEELESDDICVKETEFAMVVSKRTSSSLSSSDESSSGNSDAERILTSNDAVDEKETYEQASLTDEEMAYSQQLRKSSKKLSRKLKLESNNARKDEVQEQIPGVIVVTGGNNGTQGESKDAEDLRNQVTNHEETPNERLIGDHSGTVGEVVEVKVLLAEQSRSQEDLRERSGDEHFPASPEVNELLKRMKEVENENSLLIEDNRELKKSCRTFEGKSRLKERELEDVEEEKNDLTIQLQEMAADFHDIRAENIELRTSFAEANTKLSDVDGWVTRDVFEDIRGQLSVSLEDVEKAEEEVCELQQKMGELKVENKRIQVLEMEVERLNEKIKDDKEGLEEMTRDIKDKLNQIRDLVAEGEKLRGLVEEREKGKQDVEKKLEEAENEVNDGNTKHAEEKKEFQKRLSDREYEVLIMKEEKKELCVKLKSLESTIDSLRDELKKNQSEHEAVIEEMEQQSERKDESLSVTVSNLEQLVTERDQRIKELKKKLANVEAPESELKAKEHEYEQNKLYLKHLIALVREKDPALLDILNRTLSSRDSDDWC